MFILLCLKLCGESQQFGEAYGEPQRFNSARGKRQVTSKARVEQLDGSKVPRSVLLSKKSLKKVYPLKFMLVPRSFDPIC
jgi:hypothetical protein